MRLHAWGKGEASSSEGAGAYEHIGHDLVPDGVEVGQAAAELLGQR